MSQWRDIVEVLLVQWYPFTGSLYGDAITLCKYALLLLLLWLAMGGGLK